MSVVMSPRVAHDGEPGGCDEPGGDGHGDIDQTGIPGYYADPNNHGWVDRGGAAS